MAGVNSHKNDAKIEVVLTRTKERQRERQREQDVRVDLVPID